MAKKQLIDILVGYGEDEKEMKEMNEKELKDLLEEYTDHSDLFPNDDENDGSHEWD